MVPKSEDYKSDYTKAVKSFWSIRDKQSKSQQERGVRDQGTRGAVTGGKQMSGFIKLLRKIATDQGVPTKYIYTQGSVLPGFFRPTKEWDFVIITPKNKLVCSIELKSQVGSFGNNFNNRTEEALGSAVDIWTGFREGAFPSQEAPWLGYLIVVEKSEKSSKPVRITEPIFKVFEEFRDTSYLDRYKILCQKLIRERHYNSTAVIWTSKKNRKITFGSMDNEVSFESFINSYISAIQKNIPYFKKSK